MARLSPARPARVLLRVLLQVDKIKLYEKIPELARLHGIKT